MSKSFSSFPSNQIQDDHKEITWTEVNEKVGLISKIIFEMRQKDSLKGKIQILSLHSFLPRFLSYHFPICKFIRLHGMGVGSGGVTEGGCNCTHGNFKTIKMWGKKS